MGNRYDNHLIKVLNYNAFEHVAKDLASVLPRLDARILDVGTGTGLTGQALANLGFKNIDGWDISEKILEEAKKKKVYRNLLKINLNESKSPVVSRYDAAVSSGTFTKGHVKHNALPYIIEILNFYVLYELSFNFYNDV